MRSIVRGVVALFAAFCIMDVAKAAPTIVSPVDYSTVQTLTDTMKNLISPLNSNVSIFSSKDTADRENYETEYFYNNSVPATLSWSGTTGDCTVKVWRTNGGSESAPFFSETVSGTSTECYNLEVGCNYTWKVTDSQGNSAVGHFFTEDQAPRIIRGRRSNFTYSSGADCSNGRDIGGWATTNGKRVKQGKIYRSGQLEYCSFKGGSDIYQKMDMLYDVLGIRVDVDLRTVNNVSAFADWKAEWNDNKAFTNPYVSSGIGPDVERFTIEWATLGKGPSDGNPYVYDGKYGCQFPSYSALYNSMSIDYKVGNTTKTYTQTANQNKIAVWAAFNRIYQAVVVDKEPVIFHCSHGKDRTGSLAAVIHGLLGVSEANIKRDFATAWFCNPDYTFTQTSMNNMITGLKNFDTASTKTLAGGCEKYLISCATVAGDDAGATKVAAFKSAMLEDVETSEGNVVTPEPDEDTFTYKNYYWRRDAGGGTWTSSTGYWYKDPSDNTKKYAGGDYPDSYDVCAYLMPTKSLPYAKPAASKYRLGKLIVDANGLTGEDRLSTSTLQPYFSNEGHTLDDRSIIELRSGVCEFENMDIYLTVWGKTKYDTASSRTSVFDGLASVDVWANATMRVSDFISVSPSKTYLKFPSGNCANARFEAFEHGDSDYPYNSIGWFTGGAAGTKQYIKVQGACPLKFSASGKTSGVAGALGLEFEFGANNGTGTAAMLQVAGALNINAGSTITVDAGGNGAGTYKLVSAGTLNDYSNLDLRSNYTVTNCKDGYYGTIVKSGNNINLTIQEGTPPTEDEDEGLIDTEKEGDWGYRKTIGNEIVLAFTNHTKSVNWQVPSKLENVRFLVVGGGGGGGADNSTDSNERIAGAGGGGGGVVTGLVNLDKDTVISITVGAGGRGGSVGVDANGDSGYGGAYNGEASSFGANSTAWVTAYGGGSDQGASEGESYYGGKDGSSGGSGAGGRPYANGGAVTDGLINSANVTSSQKYGYPGGNGCTVEYISGSSRYGYGAAGGGGGATAAGTDGSKVDAYKGGNGGAGLTSDITGVATVYGSGGGGSSTWGSAGVGGEGAGDGGFASNGKDALVNQGGGGGGSSRKAAIGGAGGSGIVVLRYTTATVDPEEPVLTAVVAPTAVANLVFTGSELTGVVASDGYTLAGNTATDAGTYEATATLADGYKWSDDTTEPKTISWSIAKATNEWTTEPSISLTEWTVGEASGVLTSGVAKFGTVTSSMAELPTTAGNYTITYTVVETTNYTGLTKEVSFTIKAASVVDPDQPGGENPPTEGVVTTNAMANASWGYIVTGLGDNHNETAVVFTNENATAMTWTVPETLNNVKFLVVGGGGGAGGAASFNISSGQYNRGGAGGGGGGVVTGLVDFVEGSIVSVKVGKGGEGGVRVNNITNGTAAAISAGARSSFSIGETSYVIARGGGRDLGLGMSGGYGGSNAGSRTTSRQEKFSWEDTDVNTTYITAYEKLGKFGGKAYSKTNNVRAGAGGGGATEEGYSCTDKSNAAKGGKGLTSDITGVSAVYGSGGGGGSGYEGSGASGGSVEAGAGGGSSKDTAPNHGGDALANYGGGGGGAGREGKGGNGGSGIVVFRYTATPTTEPEEPVLTAVDAPAAVADLVYTGSELTGVVAADGYTLTGNTATDAGTYEATATLAEGYKWSDDTTAPKTISWSIAKATNEWTTEPSISLESWTYGETAGVLTSGVAKFGEVTSSMAELPTAVGKYTIIYTVVETDNYSGLTKEVSFEILKKSTSYDFTVGDVALTDGKLTFKGNFAIDGESEATETNLVVSVYDVAEGGDAIKTVTVEGIPAGEFNQEIDIAALELADGVYYLAFEVQDEAGNVLDKVEERSMLTIGEAKAVKPTVNYASGTKFIAIGVEQKPVVTSADGNGYIVSYEGDFTAAGTHRIVIALKDGWTWSDGTSDSLTYEYEFIERTYTEYYIKPRGGASEGGTFQSDDRWYTDPDFAAGSKMSTCPNVYDAHNIANIPSDSQCWLLIDNEEDIVVTPKFGKFTVDGNLRIVTYSGALMFQNDTATPMPIWEVKSGVSTIDGVVFDVNGAGTGYIDIAANATNVLGGVNYQNGFESSKKLFVRFSDEATAGSALRVHDFENYYITNFGWFEGGAEGSTYALDIEEGALSLNNPDAVSGVAGDLAITVKLGDKVGAANAYLNVAGTLNINEGSTLAVDANAMPCGVYTIINAATFNGADLLTSAAGATVTGLAEFTSGELVREGNKIVLYIETTIPPRVPGIEGDSVATNAVFETARVAKPIWYKTMPAINGDEITFNRATVNVPEYYEVTLETLADGYLVNLKLKDNLKAFIANKVVNDQIVTPAIRIENDKVYIHLENTKSDLYYTLLKSTKLGAEAEWKPTEEYAIGKADFEYTPTEGEAETCFFKAGDVMDEPPAK